MRASHFTGGHWPPKGTEVLDPWHLPLFNTLVLLTSGTTVTWAHHALLNNDRDGLKKGLLLTILLGMLFTSVQAFEYLHAPFAFKNSIYGSTFFMATGFHGFHVIVGTIFLMRLPRSRAGRPVHTETASRLRIRRLVLAFRRRRLAVPVLVHICLGIVGRGDRRRWQLDRQDTAGWRQGGSTPPFHVPVPGSVPGKFWEPSCRTTRTIRRSRPMRQGLQDVARGAARGGSSTAFSPWRRAARSAGSI